MTACVIRFTSDHYSAIRATHRKRPYWQVGLRSGGEIVAWLSPHGWLLPHLANAECYSRYYTFRRAWSAAETAVALTYPAVTAISGDCSLAEAQSRPAQE